MKNIKVLIVCLFTVLSVFCFSESQAQSNNQAATQNESITNSNYIQYEIIEGQLCLVTYTDDGKIVDIIVVE